VAAANAFRLSAWQEEGIEAWTSYSRRFGTQDPSKHSPDESTTRIVGGVEVDADDKYPFLVGLGSLGYSGSSFAVSCGGTLIKPVVDGHAADLVLTAAHCMSDTSGSDSSWQALFHGYDTTQIGSDNCTEVIEVLDYTCHPQYSTSTLQNDVCILRLAKQPDCAAALMAQGKLPVLDAQGSASVNYPGASLTVAGWGTLSSGGRQPDVMQEVDVVVESAASCQAQYGSGSILTGMTCAGILNEGGKDSCQGDSGGPLFTQAVTQANPAGTLVLAGVVSWGKGCALSSHLGVYASVSVYNDWISTTAASLGGPTPPPTTPPPTVQCFDLAGWHDVDGPTFNCDYYDANNKCDS
jgi:trypsin